MIKKITNPFQAYLTFTLELKRIPILPDQFAPLEKLTRGKVHNDFYLAALEIVCRSNEVKEEEEEEKKF